MADGLVPESFSDALIECVKAAGGSKVVGSKLFPEKTIDAAQRHLLNCLQGGRAERLSPEHVLLIFRLAREKGCHVGMAFLARELGYSEPQPIQPVDQLAQLQRDFIQAANMVSRLAEQIQSAQASTGHVLKAVS